MAEKEKTTSFTLTMLVDGEVWESQTVEKGKRLSSMPKPTKEHHTFSGWDKVPSRMPARDLTVEGHFVPNTYKLSFCVGEETLCTLELAYGAPVECPEAPEREGHTFVGWQNLPETMPGEDTIVEGVFQPQTYQITYVIRNAENKAATTSFTYPCVFGEPIPPMDLPQKDYYTFSGWENLPETMPAHDITVEGTLSLKLYKLTRIVDGEVFREEYLPYGAKVSKKPNPTKEGYYFSGFRSLPATMPAEDVEVVSSMYPARFKAEFMLNDVLSNSRYIPFGSPVEEVPEVEEGYRFEGWEDCPETMPAHDIVVHGKVVRNEYRLIYCVRGKEVHTDLYLMGAEVQTAAPFELEGFRFEGWEGVPETMPGCDVWVEGKYTLAVDKVAFYVDGESYSTYDSVDGDFVEPTPEAKEGYTFTGWNETKLGEDGVLRFEGSYAPNAYKITYMVEGEVLSEAFYSFGDTIEAPEGPARESLTFVGWADLPETMPDHDVVVVGSYTESVYHIAFAIGGNIIAEFVRPAGAEVEAPEAPEKEGYTFSGWMDPPAVMPAYDVTVNGVYNVNTYTITYMLDGELFKTETYEYGEAVSAPTPEEKEGFTFAGWGDLPATMPAGDLTVEGSMGDHNYSVTYMVGDTTVETVRCAEGTTPEMPEAPEKVGYTFECWENYPSVMPAEDVVVTAKFVANLYHLSFMLDGECIYETDLHYGDEVVLPELNIENPMFSGWLDLPETMPASDAVVTAALERKPFSLRFDLDGQLFWQEYFYVGDALHTPEVPEKDGYTFAGWRGYEAEMPDHDLVVVGFYLPHTHKITYLADGEEVALGNAMFGTAPVAPVTPKKSGYTFVGWDGLPEVMPDEDLTVSALFEEGGTEDAPEMDVVTDGFLYRFIASGEDVAEVRVPAGETPALPEAPYKYGYTFVSWADVPAEATQDAVIRAHYQPNAHHLLYLVDDIVVFDQSVNYGDPVIAADEVSAMSEVKTWNGLPDIMPDHDVVVTATLKDDQVKVTCVVLDMVEEFFFGKNTELTLPELSEKEGYDLLGWVEEVPATVGEEDLTFHANYQPHQHFVYFMCCGEEVASFKVPYGASIEIPNVARVIDDILYDAWDNVPEQMPDEEVTIHAVGRRAGCHITFVADGEEIAVLRLTAGSTIECPEAPEKEGCDFEGWSNLPEEVDNQVIISEAIYTPRLYTVDYRVKGMPFSRVEYAYGTAIEPIEAPPVKKRRFVKWSNLPDVMPACNLVVDALYMTQHSFLLAFIIDGQPFAESVLETGTRILMPTPPEKEGYVFSGWDKQVSIIAKEPIYVNGSYKPLLNTVTYYVNGEVYASYEVLTGDPIPTPDAPETGRVFLGWTRLPQTMPASDLTAEALIGATYTVAFVADGKKLEEYVVEDGQPITVPEAPEKEGFVFEGWDGLTEVAEKDLICTAKYKPMVFTVTFMVEGEVAHTAEVVFGHTVDLPEAPEVEGMIFDGWDNLPEAMPAQDVTVSALLHEAPQPEVVEEPVVEEPVAEEVPEIVEEPQPEVVEEPVVEEPVVEEVPEIVEEPQGEVVEEPVVEEPAPAVLYSVVFYLGEDEYARYEVEAGQSVPTPESPAPEIGFNGWDEIPEVMPENDLAIHAAMIPLYAIAYMVDGEEIASFAVLADQPVPTPESVPEKQGYTFEGWENYTGVASADLVCNAIYYPRVHRVTFMLGEEMLTQYELAYGESIAFIDAPEVEGKVFAGWDHELTVMPDADVVFSAVMEDAPIVEEIIEEPVVEEVVEEPAVEEVVEEPAVEEIPTYTLTLMCGEDIWATLTLAAGDPIAVPSRPELPDDAFDSWIDLPEVMPEQDIVVYAKYKEQLQLVRFMLDEELFTEYRIAPSVTVDMPDVPAKEGHVFSGWGSEPITDADNALVYCGRYIPNIHTVVFMVGKKIVHTITVPFGAVIPEGEVEAPTLENKTFFGWRDVPATMPDADVKLQAIFDARFAVTYLLDDVLFHEDILAPKAKIVPPEVPEKYGYTFAGWSEYPKKMRHEPITIKGTYAPNVHRVTFMNGENVLAAADVAYRTSIPLPPVPELEGYAFAGWDMVPDLMPNEDIVITAQYTPVDYGLTFVVDGVVFPEIRVGYGEPIPCPAVADRIGYTFVWENLPETMPAATLILQGKYLLNTHTVTYMANGETFAEQTFTYGEAITPITEKPKTKKRKYMFYRWDNLPSVMPDQDVVALASFDHRRKVMALMKTVTYKMEGQVYQTQKVLPGDIIVPPSDPFKLGYKLIAWKDLPSVMPGEDIVVEAEFELEFCTAEFRVDDAVFYSTDLPYGAEVVAPKAPIKTGYTFIEWKNAPTQMPNYSFVSDAVYHKNIYKVSYVVGDVVVHVGEFEWGRDIPLYIPEHIPHGIFEGWQGLPSIMPAEDITVFALLSIKEFKVTYLIDRDHSTFAMVPYGELIVPPKMPIREGKGVVEWKNLPDDCLMPGRDIVVEAVWGDRRHAEAYDEYLESLTDSKEQNEKGKKKLSRKEKKRQKKENKKHKKMSKKDAARQRALDVENEIRRRMRRLMR